MINKLEQLNLDGFYHIYNRANGDESLFKNNGNYMFFLAKFKQYISPFAHVYSYCLMPNHYHFLIQIKTSEQIIQYFPNINSVDIPGMISKQFSKLFSSYSQSFNKVHNRKGSLFMKPFKRILVKDEGYLRKLIHYIHYNPVEAGLVGSISDWKYSSYSSIIGHSPTLVKKKAVIEFFGDLENFKYCHSVEASLSGIE
jgi:REP element-mobilizing transposase RayT